MRTTSASVTFARPFSLPGFDRPHAPGSFEVKTDEESLGTSVEAWHRVATRILLTDRGGMQSWPVEPNDLATALRQDGEPARND